MIIKRSISKATMAYFTNLNITKFSGFMHEDAASAIFPIKYEIPQGSNIYVVPFLYLLTYIHFMLGIRYSIWIHIRGVTYSIVKRQLNCTDVCKIKLTT